MTQKTDTRDLLTAATPSSAPSPRDRAYEYLGRIRAQREHAQACLDAEDWGGAADTLRMMRWNVSKALQMCYNDRPVRTPPTPSEPSAPRPRATKSQSGA